ncbi:hypothetical protein CLF_107236 [Clonorchis sinensis]|uniref:Uncharacterized protein n=1 Tax=Clonorchis sinensis TaxID=79923 RepID=G7YGE1_CLOSI|nr:hypothetical protein CLF_107236 [Clonorchis sinensis]
MISPRICVGYRIHSRIHGASSGYAWSDCLGNCVVLSKLMYEVLSLAFLVVTPVQYSRPKLNTVLLSSEKFLTSVPSVTWSQLKDPKNLLKAAVKTRVLSVLQHDFEDFHQRRMNQATYAISVPKRVSESECRRLDVISVTLVFFTFSDRHRCFVARSYGLRRPCAPVAARTRVARSSLFPLSPFSVWLPSVDHNRCGRNGCSSNVRRGMQCHTCKAGRHFKCTGLQDDQKKAIKSKTNSPLPNQTVQCKCSSLIGVLAAKLELLSKALTDANTKNAATWTKFDKELSSLNKYLAIYNPGQLAAKKVIQLSDAAMKTATVSLVDRGIGYARKEANKHLGFGSPFPPHQPYRRSWGGPSAYRRPTQRSGVYLNTALKRRESWAILLGESTPKQPAATPNCSFYSTTAYPSTAKGCDAREEASFAWTQLPMYAELAALLSTKNDKGSAMNSAPETQLLSSSNVRRQAAKPTDKSTTCVDLNIGQCCENPTTTENAKLPVSSSTSSKVASLIVNTVVAQDPDSQNLEPDHSGPENPPQTQLHTLTVGDLGVHTCTKQRRRQPNKHHMIRQIRKLLAGFEVQSSVKTSIIGAPPNNHFSVLLSSAQGLTETPF